MKSILDVSLKSLSASQDSVTANFYFPSSLDIFRGHFPERPIVPGVLEIEMIRFCVEKHLQKTLRVSKVTKSKFLKLLSPDTNIGVEINLKSDDFGISAAGNVKLDADIAAEIRMILQEEKL